MKFEDKSLISKVTDLRMKYDLTDDKGRYIEKAEYTEGLTNGNSKMLGGSEWSIQAGEEEGEITYNLIFHPMNSIDNIDSLNFNISSISLFAPLENKRCFLQDRSRISIKYCKRKYRSLASKWYAT